MTRTRIRLETLKDTTKFITAMSRFDFEISLEDDTGKRVSAKSMLGVMYGMTEFENLYCCTDGDLGSALLPFLA